MQTSEDSFFGRLCPPCVSGISARANVRRCTIYYAMLPSETVLLSDLLTALSGFRTGQPAGRWLALALPHNDGCFKFIVFAHALLSLFLQFSLVGSIAASSTGAFRVVGINTNTISPLVSAHFDILDLGWP